MEWFWIAAPFFVFLTVIIGALKRIANKTDEFDENLQKIVSVKKVSWLHGHNFYPYLALFFLPENKYRKPKSNAYYRWSLIAYIIVFFSLFLLSSIPVVPLEEMAVTEGKIVSINFYRKTLDKISILEKAGNIVDVYATITKKTENRLLNRNIKVWHKSNFKTDNEVYQIYVDGKPLTGKNGTYFTYNIEYQKVQQNFFLWILKGALFLLLVCFIALWLLNNKELKKLK